MIFWEDTHAPIFFLKFFDQKLTNWTVLSKQQFYNLTKTTRLSEFKEN